MVIAAVLLVSLFAADPVVSQVTVINESTYPWLVAGAYADYRVQPSSSLAEPPYFVTTNGTLLLGIGPSGPGAKPAPQGDAWLNWTVISRTGGMVEVNIGFRAYGCDYSQQQVKNNENCTPYNFNTTVEVSVNLTTNEAYVGGQPQGLVNFWETPLNNGGTLNFGTAFVRGEPYTVVGNASAAASAFLGGVINDSGVMKSGPFYFYDVTGITFGTGQNSIFGWVHVSAAGRSVFYLGPYGAYDYYNGLAYFFSIPDYPINRTVCNTSSGQAVGCQYTSYATTLGNYFRSGLGTLGLVSTNVPLGPSQTSGSTTSNETSETTTSNVTPPLLAISYVVVPVAIIIAGSLLAVFYVNRKRRH
jgi:hypothetical protein